MATQKKKNRLERWVVKAGSNIVCTGGPLQVRSWMQQVEKLRREHGIEVIWVTSGAIASARERTGFQKKGKTELAEKQALSAMGQPLVMELYSLALQAVGRQAAQVLLTYDDLSHRDRCRNFQNTIEKLLSWGVVPILNENDAVATEEIRFGDNDSLSAKVARATQADRLVILTDVDGLFDSDPRTNPHAQLLRELNGVPPRLLKSTQQATANERGTGGMYSKLRAAQEATQAGIEAHLARGDVTNVLTQIAHGAVIGTHFERSKK